MIEKYIKVNYKVGDIVFYYIKIVLKKGVVNGIFVYMKGVGVLGLFKLLKE